MHSLLFPSLSLSLFLTLILLPFLTSADCAACNTFSGVLSLCQTSSSANISTLGSPIDTASVHCMCSTSGNSATWNSCLGCLATDSSSSLNQELDATTVNAWVNTCKAQEQWGDEQGVKCWEGQPTDVMYCVFKNGGAGGGRGGSNEGSPTVLGGNGPSSTNSLSKTLATSMAVKFGTGAEARGLGLFAIVVLGLSFVVGL